MFTHLLIYANLYNLGLQHYTFNKKKHIMNHTKKELYALRSITLINVISISFIIEKVIENTIQ